MLLQSVFLRSDAENPPSVCLRQTFEMPDGQKLNKTRRKNIVGLRNFAVDSVVGIETSSFNRSKSLDKYRKTIYSIYTAIKFREQVMVTRKEDTPQRVANRKYEAKNKDKRKQTSGNFQTMIPRELYNEINAFLKECKMTKVDFIKKAYGIMKNTEPIKGLNRRRVQWHEFRAPRDKAVARRRESGRD